MKKWRYIPKFLPGLLLLAIAACEMAPVGDSTAVQRQSQVWPKIQSKITPDPTVETRVAALLAKMTLEQKVGQMIQGEIRWLTPQDVKKYSLGSVLNGGGAFPNNNKYSSVRDWVSLADEFYHASMDTSDGSLAIPIIWGTDAVHGHNNVIGATLFPHNIALGAAHNPQLIKKIAQVTAKEVVVTGIDWIFAPTVAVVRDDRWGRSYEGYSEDPELVEAYAGQLVEGLQGRGGSNELFDDNHVVATAKHFIGDGGTQKGTDQGNTIDSEVQLRDIHGVGYFETIRAGVQTVMSSFSSWQGDKLHGHHYLLTEVLKKQMGFDGFVVGDWNGHGQLNGCDETRCAKAINAGVDMLMAPEHWRELLANTIEQVRAGVIPMARIDDAVTRILRVKMRAGLFDRGAPSTRRFAGQTEYIGAAEHRDVAREAVRQSLVLLKNRSSLLPLNPTMNVLVAGDGADNIGKQAGGWSITWQGTGNKNEDFPGATSIYQGIKETVTAAGGRVTLSETGDFVQADTKPDVAIVVYGENPYAEGQGDLQSIDYQGAAGPDLALLQKLRSQGIPVVSVFLSGRPLWVNPELNASDAFVAAWLPGTEGAAIADVLFSKVDGSARYDFAGRLSFSWPMYPDQVVLNRHDKNYKPLFAYGYGLTYQDKDLLSDSLPEQPRKVNNVPNDSTVDLFIGRPKAPWTMSIADIHSGQHILTGSSGSIKSIAVMAVDKQVQEDARKIVWKGNGQGVFSLQAQHSQDLSFLLPGKGALRLDIKVDNRPTAPVIAKFVCNLSCAGEQLLTKALSELPLGVWSPLSIDLACFSRSAAHFRNVRSVFSLETSGHLTLSLANIQLLPVHRTPSDIRCS